MNDEKLKCNEERVHGDAGGRNYATTFSSVT